MDQTRASLLAVLFAALPASLAAQAPAVAPIAEPDGDAAAVDDSEIVVTGQRQAGAVLGDIPPDVQLNPAQIRSYGVTSVAELLAELAPQTRSGRGRGGDAPVTLLNGRRISGFAEIRDIPAEAILRVDILPEEVALKYGYKADQRVVNIVLRPRFRAFTAEAEARLATEGGALTPSTEASYLRIDKRGRFNLAGEYRHTDGLLENDRDLVQSAPRRPFDLAGNVVAPAGAASSEIDPGLSALAGRVVTVAAVPAAAGGGAPSLAAFVAGAGVANVTDIGRFRSLLASSDTASLNAVLNRGIGAVNATINARFDYSNADALLGLPTVALILPAGNPFSPFSRAVEVDRYAGDALRQTTRGLTGQIGLSADGVIGSWRWSLTANANRADTRTLTDRGVDASGLQVRLTARDASANPFGPLGPLLGDRLTDRADTASTSGNADVLLTGTLADLPAGAATASVRGGLSALGFDTSSTRAGVVQAGRVTRSDASGRVSVDVPLASRRRDVLAFAGDLSVNFNASLDRLSDFGTLRDLGAGVTWSPVKPVSVVVSYTDEDGAPTPQQLGNPQVATPQVTVFDFRRGQSVDVTRLDGGNPGLDADNRRVLKAGLTLKPWEKTDLSLTANYVRSTTRNAIAAFPSAAASPEIEAAFPDRFVRDASGALIQIDARPVNFSRTEREEIRWGINFSKALRSAADDRLAALRAGGGRPGEGRGAGQGRAGQGGTGQGGTGAGGGRGPGGGPGGGRGFGGGGFGGGGSRLQAAVYYTLHLEDNVLIRPGVPLLDLLDGAATGNRGGQPRHEVEVQAGVTRSGLGARLSANWQSATFVAGTAAAPGGRLDFGDIGTINLRVFANLGQLPGAGRKHPWLRGTRVLVAVDNLANARQRVTDATGATPTGLQPGRLDPLGRSVRLSLRKLFF